MQSNICLTRQFVGVRSDALARLRNVRDTFCCVKCTSFRRCFPPRGTLPESFNLPFLGVRSDVLHQPPNSRGPSSVVAAVMACAISIAPMSLNRELQSMGADDSERDESRDEAHDGRRYSRPRSGGKRLMFEDGAACCESRAARCESSLSPSINCRVCQFRQGFQVSPRCLTVLKHRLLAQNNETGERCLQFSLSASVASCKHALQIHWPFFCPTGVTV